MMTNEPILDVHGSPHRHKRRFLFLLLAAACVLVVAFLFLPRPFRPKTPGRVRFALCQYESRIGEVRWNFDHAMRFASEAAAHKADVVVLPEFSFSSTLDVGMGKARFKLLRRPYARKGIWWFARTRGCYLIVNHPAPYKGTTNTIWRNETLVFNPSGRVMAKYWKRVLSSMDIGFAFSKGDEPVIAEFPFGRVGLMVCKDSCIPLKAKPYRKADLVLVRFANIGLWADEPGLLGLSFPISELKDDLDTIAKRCARGLVRPLLMVNKTGLENEYLYLGGSRAYSANGAEVARLGTGSGILYVDFLLGKDGKILPGGPVLPEL